MERALVVALAFLFSGALRELGCVQPQPPSGAPRNERARPAQIPARHPQVSYRQRFSGDTVILEVDSAGVRGIRRAVFLARNGRVCIVRGSTLQQVPSEAARVLIGVFAGVQETEQLLRRLGMDTVRPN